MNRRRLAAFAGAIGLLGALFSSGVAAQAETLPGVDSTLSSLISTYLSSSQDACVGGTSTYNSLTQTTTCTIDETSTGDKNMAVCVQSNTPGSVQDCEITQNNVFGNNYALIFQHVVDNSGPTEDATQRATIARTCLPPGRDRISPRLSRSSSNRPSKLGTRAKPFINSTQPIRHPALARTSPVSMSRRTNPAAPSPRHRRSSASRTRATPTVTSTSTAPDYLESLSRRVRSRT